MGLFVVVGATGKILTSPDGITWTSQTGGVSVTLQGVTYSEPLGLFVAVGAVGTILTSLDGITWTSQTSEVSTDLYSAVYSEHLGLFVAVGATGTILYTQTVPNINIIDRLTADSDMSFNLEPGDNKVQIYNVPRNTTARLTYRQKYIGV